MATSSFTARGSRRRCNDRERSLANALRRESLQLDRTLRSLGLQYHKDLAGVCGAQLVLKRTLDRLGSPRGELSHLGRSTTAPTSNSTSTPGTLLQPRGPAPTKHCCPNHIVCSTCNLRLRLADTVTRQFTPSLWTMYCRPLTEHRHGEACIYRMPSFVERRNLSASDNSLRYLPFM